MSSLIFSLFYFLSVAFWPFGGGREETESVRQIKKTALEIPADQKAFETLRISLLEHVPHVKLEISGPYRVKDSKGRPLFRGMRIAASVKPASGGIQLGPQIFHDTPITVESEASGIKIDGKLYRQAVVLWLENNQTLSVINAISVEEYLKGVLPHEVSPSWPIDALKAQAVASRTYALFKALENGSERSHLSKGVMSQVYGGSAAEHPATTRAIEETRGEILTYRGKIFPAYFHSTCGGATTRADFLWDVEPHPSLEGVQCNFCWASKHTRWDARFGLKEIEKRLRLRGFSILGVTEIRTAELDKTGRARFIDVMHAGGKTRFHSNDFRLWVDPLKLKSTWIQRIQITGGAAIIEGRGWGHGVGLCQYGTKQLGELGYSYRQILDYYYPESEIRKIL